MEALKWKYHGLLLQDLILLQDKDIFTFFKDINERIALAWDQTSAQTIRRSWQKLATDEEYVTEAIRKSFVLIQKISQHLWI